jgi:hypothetical protein
MLRRKKSYTAKNQIPVFEIITNHFTIWAIPVYVLLLLLLALLLNMFFYKHQVTVFWFQFPVLINLSLILNIFIVNLCYWYDQGQYEVLSGLSKGLVIEAEIRKKLNEIPADLVCYPDENRISPPLSLVLESALILHWFHRFRTRLKCILPIGMEKLSGCQNKM